MNSARSLLLTCAAWSLLVSEPAHGQSSAVLSAEIAPQPVAHALNEFAARTGLQIIYLSEIAATQMSKGAPRGLAAREALERLLEDTGLEFEYLNERTVRIFAAPGRERRHVSSAAAVLSGHTRTAAHTRLVALEEVVVTARRREEPLGDVPISAAVWTQAAMEASGVKGIDEIGALTPGVEFDFVSRFGEHFTNIVIRGVTDMHGTTTGILLDDTPLPPGRGETFLRVFPVAFDLDRIEVLRGPQGGLLGQDALGGTIRFVANEPSLTTFSGLARTELASTARGDASYEAGVAAGGPVIPGVLGIRVSGWYRSDGGYVNRVDPFTGETLGEDINGSTTRSFRGALTWMPGGSLWVTPSLTWQSVHYRDPSSFYVHLSSPSEGELVNGSLVQLPFDDEFYVGSLKLSAEFSRVGLSSVSAYIRRKAAVAIDLSLIDQPVRVRGDTSLDQTVLSNETRLTSPDPDAALGWVAGVWYSTSRTDEDSSVDGFPETVRSTVTDQTQFAGFGQLSFRFTKRLSASAGVRVGRSHYDSVTEVPPTSRAENTDTSTTPRFGLTYQSDRYGMFYATVAKGYRDGGVYAPVLSCGYSPQPYAADSLWSYEVGSKSSLLDRRVDLDASVFHIVWDNHDSSPGTDCVPNNYRPVSAAVSNGFNLAARIYPTDRVRIGLAVAYVDARYTGTVRSGDDVVIEDGDALGGPPQVPAPWSMTASIEHDVAIFDGVAVTVRAEDIFHSENPGPFYTDHPASAYYSPDRDPDPSTNVLNLRAVVAWPSFDAALFVNNALDSQPTLGRVNACCADPLFTATTFRPRTIGVSATWRF